MDKRVHYHVELPATPHLVSQSSTMCKSTLKSIQLFPCRENRFYQIPRMTGTQNVKQEDLSSAASIRKPSNACEYSFSIFGTYAAHMQTNTHIHTLAHAHIHTCVRICICIHKGMCKFSFPHTWNTHTHMHVRVPKHMNKHTHREVSACMKL